jgi:hypothetical protein
MTMHNAEHLHPNGESHHIHGQTPYSGADYSPCSLLSVFTSEPTTCRWCLPAARSKCRPAAEFRRFSGGNL